ncbi:c-type cytochrome biogenesis protein CcmI [Methylobacillus caricis]|uniref:c-type cytochrome biogenesis protein CcmI n=1 Tax=Methylobacillus caricis TaxID=1971611 RepID=UPI001D000CDB|nr:c-type cytochrome biogenesis protein CcmI [Methylobacillus caricis]MCB5188141.1 c-type cytochrome biogenesis protein CcmI [Methylobacillus caricis]
MMLVFWGIATLLLLITLFVLLPPLLRRRVSIPISSSSAVAAVYREQLAELEQDRDNGVLDVAQYQQARNELERRLLEEAQDISRDRVTGADSGRPDRLLAVLLLVLVPVFAVLIYLKAGNPQALDVHDNSPDSQTVNSEDVPANIELILQSLKQQLESDPGDGAGWALLARADAKLHRYDEAVQAFENAVRIIPDDPNLLVDYAITLAFINQHNMAGKPEELVNRALELDPEQVKALMLAASAAFDRQDYPRAIILWQRLLQKLPPGSEAYVSVSAALDEARKLAGEKP